MILRNSRCRIVPVGDGVILSGVYKGFRDLKKAKLIRKIPKIVAVQAEGSNALANAFRNKGEFPKINAKTVADSISVDVPRNGYHALKQLIEFSGDVCIVSDDEY